MKMNEVHLPLMALERTLIQEASKKVVGVCSARWGKLYLFD